MFAAEDGAAPRKPRARAARACRGQVRAGLASDVPQVRLHAHEAIGTQVPRARPDREWQVHVRKNAEAGIAADPGSPAGTPTFARAGCSAAAERARTLLFYNALSDGSTSERRAVLEFNARRFEPGAIAEKPAVHLGVLTRDQVSEACPRYWEVQSITNQAADLHSPARIQRSRSGARPSIRGSGMRSTGLAIRTSRRSGHLSNPKKQATRQRKRTNNHPPPYPHPKTIIHPFPLPSSLPPSPPPLLLPYLSHLFSSLSNLPYLHTLTPNPSYTYLPPPPPPPPPLPPQPPIFRSCFRTIFPAGPRSASPATTIFISRCRPTARAGSTRSRSIARPPSFPPTRASPIHPTRAQLYAAPFDALAFNGLQVNGGGDGAEQRDIAAYAHGNRARCRPSISSMA